MQDIKKEIDQLAKLDVHPSEFSDKLKDIHDLLNIQSIQMQHNLSNITFARSRSNHPQFPLHSKLKYLPIDQSELNIVEQNPIPLSESITIQHSSSSPIKLEQTSDDHQSVRLIQTSSSHEITALNVKSIPSKSSRNNKHTIKLFFRSSIIRSR